MVSAVEVASAHGLRDAPVEVAERGDEVTAALGRAGPGQPFVRRAVEQPE